MKLVRFDAGNGVRPGLLKDGGVVEITHPAFQSIKEIVRGGESALQELSQFSNKAPVTFALDRVRLLAPIEQPGKYLAIGMNYKKHMEEVKQLGIEEPKHQFWFNKQTTCISGPYDVIDPGVTEKLDYEVELGVVIGKPAKGVSPGQAHEHIFGYFVANDVSARDWQFHSPSFTMGKSFDTHGPMGPYLVTKDEIPDPHAVDLRCWVNGTLRQSSNTRFMIHNIYQQISYLSTAFTLESGDLIATGTPDGVGVSMTPPSFLKLGDVVRCEIDGIGAIENRVARR